jgi:hypothetical protein
LETASETEAPYVQPLPPMELGGRLSNPDFLARIEQLLKKLDEL